MVATIDYTTEAKLSTLLSDVQVQEVTKYLGLDPSVARKHQPIDVELLLCECLHTIESYQASVILEKTVILDLPYEALCKSHGRIYLPYGPTSLTDLVVSYYEETTGAVGDPGRTRTTIAQTLFVSDLNYPAFLFCEDWTATELTDDIDTDIPLPFRVSYTAGYSSFAAMPNSIYQAMKVLAYYTFTNRGEASVDLPLSYHHFADENLLTNRDVQEYIL